MATTITPPSPNNKASAYYAKINHVKHAVVAESKEQILVDIVDNR
jgi:hypothetical protein